MVRLLTTFVKPSHETTINDPHKSTFQLLPRGRINIRSDPNLLNLNTIQRVHKHPQRDRSRHLRAVPMVHASAVTYTTFSPRPTYPSSTSGTNCLPTSGIRGTVPKMVIAIGLGMGGIVGSFGMGRERRQGQTSCQIRVSFVNRVGCKVVWAPTRIPTFSRTKREDRRRK